MSGVGSDSFLLQLLVFAGWRLQVRQGPVTRIHATRDGVRLEVTGSSLAEAAGTVFARAMRSGRDLTASTHEAEAGVSPLWGTRARA